MKKKFLSVALLLSAMGAYSQVGIGTLTPNPSSQLDVVAKDKGILIPRVSLTSTTDMTTISNGNVNSLLVFNTNTQNDVAPGYYYWYEDKWLRIVNTDDLVALDQNTKNVLLSVVGDELVLQDSDNDTVTVPLSQINILTNLVDNTDGTFTYTNEAGTAVTISIPANVINNIQTILGDTNVLNELIEVLGDTYVGGNVYYDGTQFTYVDQSGATHIINFEDIVQANETVTTIVKNTDGTYTYTNEADATFVIDVPASVVEQFENIYNQIVNEEIVVNGDTYNTFEEYLTHIANEAVTINGGDMITVTGTGTATDPYMVNIDKGTANSMLITNAAGELEWATIEDIVQGVQKTVTIIDGMNTTVDANVSGNNTEYKVNVATAKGADGTTAANLGLVKEAADNPTVSVSQTGELSVNLENINAIKEVSSNYNAILEDAILLGNANAGDITITLPDAVGNKGKKFTIKKQDSNEDYYVNVVGSINGLSQLYTALPHSGWELVSDGTTWKITNKF